MLALAHEDEVPTEHALRLRRVISTRRDVEEAVELGLDPAARPAAAAAAITRTLRSSEPAACAADALRVSSSVPRAKRSATLVPTRACASSRVAVAVSAISGAA